ncbi:hypothetical protein LTR37_010139 [Vermiconidia calcicola]|uniref:Uncharacterized protein n=1 Tax=Vermiconidia calcicola TaxID=1690605 RepID=A0ACC3N728_9PEZI|nr:hypothetical protein LTR37_010139 [Vermiconidia calcicola]
MARMFINRTLAAQWQRKLLIYIKPAALLIPAKEREPPRRALPRDDPNHQVLESDDDESDSGTSSIDWVFVASSQDTGNDDGKWEIISVQEVDAESTSGVGLGIVCGAPKTSYIDECDFGESFAFSWENVPSMTSTITDINGRNQGGEASALVGEPNYELFLPTRRLPPGTTSTDPALRQHHQTALSRRFDTGEMPQCGSDEVNRATETPLPRLRYAPNSNSKAPVAITKLSEEEWERSVATTDVGLESLRIAARSRSTIEGSDDEKRR